MSVIQLFWLFLRLGLTSFGGPVAHLGYFQHEFVKKREWLTDSEYAELVALCQFLPGPASSQVGMAIGYKMAGQKGCLAAWVGFTLPSALLMAVLGAGVYLLNPEWLSPVIQSFLLVAIAVVAHAVWGMYQKLCGDTLTRCIALASALLLLYVSFPFLHILIIVMAGMLSFIVLPTLSVADTSPEARTRRARGFVWFAVFTLLLLLLPILAQLESGELIALFDINYRAGALVFGGGHVVLPLLENEIVANGWMKEGVFLTGYGFAQALPGPLFTFSTFIGSVMVKEQPLIGALVATIAVFLPGYLLLMSALPHIQGLRQHPHLSKALVGINASVVGILLAAFINPVLIKGIQDVIDIVIAILGFYLLNNKKRPILEVMSVIILLSLCKTWLI
ncbi:chromate efflux transporter [Alteromonas sediminis]|uniref:Chromate efflux transporter n=1 Tax=Alteromonas sediminis TaxID=2259342 RepID=A0A3N5YNV1_9ALTE|nr:chromate efflux transporter [Alteromonas sediminis]RPJ67391.1 chromate efflux transporter [Alteromonas sediminis]